MSEVIAALIGAGVMVLCSIASNAFFYGKLVERVHSLQQFQGKVERHLGWDGTK